MKKFEELNDKQKKKAIRQAKADIKFLIEEKIILADKHITNSFINELALLTAQESWYTEESDKIMDNIA